MSDSANKGIAREDSDSKVVDGNIEKLEKYEATIRRRVECEERAFHIVNKLIYDCVEPQYLIECGKLISRDNYGDIVEERAISKLCGYPLCDNEIANVPKQKYHISTKSNKVYDITERKNFCSNQCLKASKAFQSQILESPVWARENEPPAEFTLLPHKSVKGIIGTEVVGEPPWKFLDEEIKNLKELESKDALSTEKRKKDKVYDETKVYKHKSNTTKTVSEKDKASSANEECAHSKDNSDNVISDFENLSIRGKGEETESLQQSPPCFHKVQICSSKEEQNFIINVSECDSDKTLSKENHVKSVKKNNASPLERLNALLAKKKNILSGMVDIQEVASMNLHSNKPVETLQHGMDKEPHASSSSSLDDSLACESSTDRKKLSGHPRDPLSLSMSIEADDSDQKRFKKKWNDKTHDHQFPLDRIGKVLQLWVTDNTKQYLKRPSSGSRADVTNAGFSNPSIQSGYMDLCKRLNLQEQGVKQEFEEMTDLKANGASANLRSLPDYKYLKEESEGFQLKVTEFITGKRIKDQKSTKEKEDKMDSDPVYLPTVDIYDQKMIRAKIVLDRLDKSFPELLGPMGLTMQNISTDLRDLIYSFRLERDNIVFKPSEWTLVALLLLKMLAIRVYAVNSAFKTETALKYLNILLKGIGHNHHNLQEVVDYILQ